jgi:2-hydroxychromene-2-carboxylate isomerase
MRRVTIEPAGVVAPHRGRMAETLDYYYWITSDWAYFGNPRMIEIVRRHGLELNYRPIDLAVTYIRTGGLKLQMRSKEQRDYRLVEMRRFREELGMPINLTLTHPPATGHLPSYFIIAAQSTGHDVYELNHAMMKALWVEERDIEDAATLVDIADNLGLNGSDILQRAMLPAAEATYIRYTNEAIARGVFGAPFYCFRNEPFWGQDRLAMLDATIARTIALKA